VGWQPRHESAAYFDQVLSGKTAVDHAAENANQKL